MTSPHPRGEAVVTHHRPPPVDNTGHGCYTTEREESNTGAVSLTSWSHVETCPCLTLLRNNNKSHLSSLNRKGTRQTTRSTTRRQQVMCVCVRACVCVCVTVFHELPASFGVSFVCPSSLTKWPDVCHSTRRSAEQ